MKNPAFYNGSIGELSELTVPFCERVCYFGDGVYDATYARNGVIFTAKEHIDRLYRSANAVGIDPPFPKEQLQQLLSSLVEKADSNENLVYVQFTRGISIPRNHLPIDLKTSVWVSITPKKITQKDSVFKLCSVPDTRYSLCYIKTLNLLPNVLASITAAKANCDEAVFVEKNGDVNECAHSNLHIVANGTLISPAEGEKVLGGIARSRLIAACKTLEIPVSERHFTVEELRNADEIYVTSAGTLLTPVRVFNGFPVGGKDALITERLQTFLYDEFLHATDR